MSELATKTLRVKVKSGMTWLNAASRECTKCLTSKPASAFNRRRDVKNSHSRRSWCKACELSANRAWGVANRARRAEYSRLLLKRDPRKTMLRAAKKRAVSKGLPFALTLDDIRIPPVCPILGIPIRRLDGRHHGSPSLDRVNNGKGYTPDNIQVISLRANSLKSDATVEELERVLASMRASHDRDCNAAVNILRIGLGKQPPLAGTPSFGGFQVAATPEHK